MKRHSLRKVIAMVVTGKVFRLHYKGKPVGYMRFSDPKSNAKYNKGFKVIQFSKGDGDEWSGSIGKAVKYDSVEMLI